MHLEMEEIRKEDEAEKAAGFISVWKLFTMQSLRWQLISMIVLMAGQQLSGVNAVRASCELGVLTKRGWGVVGHWPSYARGPLPTPMLLLQIYYYADQIYLSAGVKSDDVQYVTAGTGAVNVFMTILTVGVCQATVP